MPWQGWDDYQPPVPGAKPTGPVAPPPAQPSPAAATPAPARAAGRRGGRAFPMHGDRGTRRGARRVVVTEDRQVVELALAKASGAKGESFQSKREALVWVGRLGQQDRGEVRGLRRQVRFALQAKRPDGLLETVSVYIADFVFEEPIDGDRWRTVVEDVKPAGGLREDTYKLKRKWFSVQYGIEIRETH